MKCPVDGADLQMADRSGVEIDYCPQCRGVWLDRGELDKIIERSTAAMPAAAPPPPRHHGDQQDRAEWERGERKRRGPGSFLGELFDFD